MAASSNVESGSRDQLSLVRDMALNGRRCMLRVTVAGANDVGVAFTATDDQGAEVGSISGTVRRADLLTVVKAISSFLGATAVALGEAVPSTRADLEAIRRIYPNAYEPWTADEDERLVRRRQEGATMLELIAELGRNAGAIISRLNLHGLPKPPVQLSNEEYAEPDAPDLASDNEEWA